MAQLIYRGVEHDGATEFAPRVPMTLIYRGQSHDGMTLAAPAPRRAVQMVYRGVAYSVGGERPAAPRSTAPAPRKAARKADYTVAEYA